MNAGCQPPLSRAVAWLVIVAMLLPALAGCATGPASTTVTLDGIVVDGQRLARPGEVGLARVVRDGTAVQARAGMALRNGDRVETGPNAEVVIRYPSGTELLMRPNSSGRIGSFTDVVGEIFVKVKGLFSVETTYVRAGARGTAYLVRSGPGGTTTVIVFDGTVVVESTTRAWASITLGAGSMAVAHPSAPQPMPARTEDLQRTQDWVERLERLVPAQTAVSGTGVAAAIAVGALVAAILVSRDRESSSGPSRESPQTPRTPQTPQSPQTPQTPQAPPPLVAPDGRQPGAPRPSGPLLNCTSNLTLRWNAVKGARDYIVMLESLPANSRTWQRAKLAPTGATQVTLGRSQGLGGSNRWSVQARNAGTLGPVSPTMYFLCDFSGVR